MKKNETSTLITILRKGALFLAAMVLSILLFGLGEATLCPMTAVTIIAMVTFGLTEMVTTLKVAVGE